MFSVAADAVFREQIPQPSSPLNKAPQTPHLHHGQVLRQQLVVNGIWDVKVPLGGVCALGQRDVVAVGRHGHDDAGRAHALLDEVGDGGLPGARRAAHAHDDAAGALQRRAAVPEVLVPHHHIALVLWVGGGAGPRRGIPCASDRRSQLFGASCGGGTACPLRSGGAGVAQPSSRGSSLGRCAVKRHASSEGQSAHHHRASSSCPERDRGRRLRRRARGRGGAGGGHVGDGVRQWQLARCGECKGQWGAAVNLWAGNIGVWWILFKAGAFQMLPGVDGGSTVWGRGGVAFV